MAPSSVSLKAFCDLLEGISQELEDIAQNLVGIAQDFSAHEASELPASPPSSQAEVPQGGKAHPTNSDQTPKDEKNSAQANAEAPPLPDATQVAVKQAELAASKGQAVKDSPLFKLSAEIRNMIYSYALATDNERVDITKNGVPEPPLLSTCKIIRIEAIGIFYNINIPLVISQHCHPAASVIWKKKKAVLLAQYGLQTKEHQKFMGRKNWHNLKLWLREIHAGKATPTSFVGAHGNNIPSHQLLQCMHMRGMQSVVQATSTLPWERVEPILEDLRVGLVSICNHWASDEIIEN